MSVAVGACDPAPLGEGLRDMAQHRRGPLCGSLPGRPHICSGFVDRERLWMRTEQLLNIWTSDCQKGKFHR